jgi:hypothetical protein
MHARRASCAHIRIYIYKYIHTCVCVCVCVCMCVCVSVCCVYAGMHCRPGQHHGSAEVGDFKDAIVGDENVGTCRRRFIFF